MLRKILRYFFPKRKLQQQQPPSGRSILVTANGLTWAMVV